jgi:hypothetical protein
MEIIWKRAARKVFPFHQIGSQHHQSGNATGTFTPYCSRQMIWSRLRLMSTHSRVSGPTRRLREGAPASHSAEMADHSKSSVKAPRPGMPASGVMTLVHQIPAGPLRRPKYRSPHSAILSRALLLVPYSAPNAIAGTTPFCMLLMIPPGPRC